MYCITKLSTCPCRSENKSKRYRLDESGEVLDHGDTYHAVGDVENHTDSHPESIEYNHHDADPSGGEINDLSIHSMSDDATHGFNQHIEDSPAGSISGVIEDQEDSMLQEDHDLDQDQNGYEGDDYGGHSMTDLNDEGLLDSPTLPPPSNPIDYSATPSNAPIPSMPGHPVTGVKEVEVGMVILLVGMAQGS